MALLKYREFIIKHLSENFDADITTISQITDAVIECLETKISEIAPPKSITKRKSGYNILANILNHEQTDDTLKLIEQIGKVSFSRHRDYANKTALKVKTISDDLFITYNNINDAYSAAKSQSLAGFALTAFIWANLEPPQKQLVNNFAIGNTIKSPPPKNDLKKNNRKGGHNCIKTVAAHAITKNFPPIISLLKLPEYKDKDKGREVGQQLWKQIKDNSELIDKWHLINEKLPKNQKERKNTVDSEPEFFQLLQDSINFVLP